MFNKNVLSAFRISQRVKPKTNLSAIRFYDAKVIEHFNNPKNTGSFDKKDDNVGTGVVGSIACGDLMKLQIRVNPDTNTIVDSRFKTYGCTSAIASSSYGTEYIKGKTLDEAGKLTNKDIAKELNLPPVKLHCSTLGEEAVQEAIKDYQQKQEKHKCKNHSK